MTGPEKISIDGSRLRLQTIVRLRWVAVTGQLITVLAVHYGLGFNLPVALCLAAIGLSACLNISLQAAFPANKRLVSRYAMLMLGYDILQLSILIYLTGGLQNPFALLMVVPVAVSAATQPVTSTAPLAGLAVVCGALLTVFHQPLPWGGGEPLSLPFTYIVGVWVALVSCIMFIALYAWRTSRETRLMSEALAATEVMLAREQKLTALDGLAAAAAHQLGTPLSTIVVIAKELERTTPDDSPIREDVQLLRSQAMRCREILGTLTRYTGETDTVFSRMALTHVLEDVVEPYRMMGIAVSVKASAMGKHADVKEPVAARNPGVIYGLSNLVENAVDFAATSVDVTAQWDDGIVLISIMDDGPGFSGAVINQLGEPYITTRAATGDGDGPEHGLGLGFFIAKTLLERSGATLQIGNRPSPETGAVVRIKWPRNRLERPDGIDSL